MSTLTPAGKKHPARVNTIKRSVNVDGHRTSVSLEDEFWDGLREVARHKNLTVSALVATIASGRDRNNLSSEIRVFVLNHFRTHGGQKILSNETRPGHSHRKQGPLYRRIAGQHEHQHS